MVIDLFCGAGGLGLGLKRAGFDILLSFDIDKDLFSKFALYSLMVTLLPN